MNAVGIIAEYNPFHSGHLQHLCAVRAAVGENMPVVAVLSGDFVQRGESAAFSKFARAEAAVRCGVSLVLELPLPWCLSSAEGFARGGAGLLAATGVVDMISFGSECGDLEVLTHCADALDRENFPAALHRELEGGRSFAAARERAVREIIGKGADVLRAPNDLLAVEYIRASRSMGAEFTFLPVRRTDSVHDGHGSASEIRAVMDQGEAWLDRIPARAAEVFRREIQQGRGPVNAGALELCMMSRLRLLTPADYIEAPDVVEGLEHRLYKAVRSSVSPETAAAAAKSKRYALSRLRRSLLCAALGVKKEMADGTPPYIRVLAMDGKGAALLNRMRGTAAVPVITKPAHIRRAGERTEQIFALGSDAHDLYALGYADRMLHTAGGDYTAAPFVL